MVIPIFYFTIISVFQFFTFLDRASFYGEPPSRVYCTTIRGAPHRSHSARRFNSNGPGRFPVMFVMGIDKDNALDREGVDSQEPAGGENQLGISALTMTLSIYLTMLYTWKQNMARLIVNVCVYIYMLAPP